MEADRRPPSCGFTGWVSANAGRAVLSSAHARHRDHRLRTPPTGRRALVDPRAGRRAVEPPRSTDCRAGDARQRPRDYKDDKLAELWRGPRIAAGEGWGSESIPEATPSALTPVAVQLRTFGVKRAMPRRIHGVRLAITATARSDLRIAVRGPGVGVDASSASADPAGGPRRFDRQQLPGAGHAAQPDTATVLEPRPPADDQGTSSRSCLVSRSRHLRGPQHPLGDERREPTW
jgi:hypothetical protein